MAMAHGGAVPRDGNRPCRRTTTALKGKKGRRSSHAHHADIGVVGEVEGCSVWPESTMASDRRRRRERRLPGASRHPDLRDSAET